uniref:Uncharacterized protein n=1 Tax=Oryza nivara TaxID=4536 RepID=A0A0E0J3S0_ORYNI
MVPMVAMVEGHHPADGASSSAAVCGGGEGVWRRGRSPGAGAPSTVGRTVGGGLGRIAEGTMLLTDDDPSCADWWCGFGQGIAGADNGDAVWRRSPPWRRCFSIPLSFPYHILQVKTLLRFRTSSGGDPRRILLEGTALEKSLRARILSLVYALASNFSPKL